MDIQQLSRSELKVAHYVAMGYQDKGIAHELCNSPHTIAKHVRNIQKKLNLHNRVQVAVKFILGLDDKQKFEFALA